MSELDTMVKSGKIGFTENYNLKRRRATVFWLATLGVNGNWQARFENEPTLEISNNGTFVKLVEIDTTRNFTCYIRLKEFEHNLGLLEKRLEDRFNVNAKIDLIGESEKLSINTPLTAKVHVVIFCQQ